MSAPKGHPRYGGRGKGTPNKRPSLIALCNELGVDPLRRLLEICKDEKDPNHFNAVKEACQYIVPKLKALDVQVDADLLAVLDRAREIELLPDEELKKLAGK